MRIGPDERRQKIMQDAITQIALARLLEVVQSVIADQKRLNSPPGTNHHTEVYFTAEEALYLEKILSDLLTQPDPMTIMRG